MGFSSLSALKMDASNITRKTFSTSSSLLRSVRPFLSSQRVSYRPFLHNGHQFPRRNSRRLCSFSSEPPLLHSQGESSRRHSKLEYVEDDCDGRSTSTLQNPANLEAETNTGDIKDGVSAIADQELLKGGEVELKSGSSGVGNDAVFRNVDPSSLGRRRKRKQFVAKAPKRLNSDEEDLGFMQEALAEARKGAMKGEVPVGAVLVHNKKIIARFHNQVEAIGDPTAHAEMLCIRSAAAQLGGWRLTDVSMYVTLEPCPMCAGAILQGRVSELVWGARNSLLGADGSWIKLFSVPSGEYEPEGKDYLHPFHRSITVRRGVLAEESAEIMQSFFAMRRLQPKCRIDDAHIGVKSIGWFPLDFRKLNSWVRSWFQFLVTF